MPRQVKLTRLKIEALEKRFTTQKALADWLGVSTRAVRYWKTGERTPTIPHKKVMFKEYKQAASATGLKKPSTRQVKEYYEGKRREIKAGIAGVELTGRETDPIPKYSISTGIPNRRYHIFADVLLENVRFKYGGEVEGKPNQRIISLAVGIKSPNEFQQQFDSINKRTIEMASKYGDVISIKYFRAKRPV